MSSIQWVGSWSSEASVPPNAVVGGYDGYDGGPPLYVARALHELIFKLQLLDF